MSDAARPMHLGVAIDGFGAHPAAWTVERSGGGGGAAADGASMDRAAARPTLAMLAMLLAADTYVQRAQRAEAGGFDFVVLDDAMVPAATGSQPLALGARLDALLTLARVAPHTSRVGLVASVNTTHTEPFNVGKNVATLDWVSAGRAGWRPVVAEDTAEYGHFGRRSPLPAAEVWAEAADVVDVVARLADSWEDGAIIRDQPSGRYLDRDRVHYIDFHGPYFSVRGPSITPRSPQAQPPVVIEATGPAAALAEAVAVRWADIIVIDATDPATGCSRREALRAEVAAVGRDPDTVSVLVNAEVLLGATLDGARSELAALDQIETWGGAGARWRFVGAAHELAPTLVQWRQDHAADGFLLRPARLPVDLDRLVDGVIPALVTGGLRPGGYSGRTLRAHLGLARPVNRYASEAHQ